MIAPALPRWLDAVLSAPATGVNALLPDVPRGGSEAPPPAVVVYNAMDDESTARGRADRQAKPELFALAIRLAEQMDFEGNPAAGGDGQDTCLVLVDLHGIATDGANDRLLADAFRTLRAVRRCLNHAFVALGMEGLELEGQWFTPPDVITSQTLDPEAGSGAVQLVLHLPFTMTDTWALSPIPEP